MTTISQLDRTLSSLAESIDWPTPSPQLGSRVIAGIESQTAEAGARGWRRAVPATAAVLLVALVVVVSPTAREAVADLFSAAGIRIGVGSDPLPTAVATLELGDSVAFDSLQETVDFDLRIPITEDPGQPDAFYLSEDAHLTMVWVAGPSLPAAGNTGIGLLLTQQDAVGVVDIGQKELGADTRVQRLTVEGQPGLWIEGAAHVLTLLDEAGRPIEETTRLAANVLLWDFNGVSHRLETTADLEEALAIVAALQPLP